MLVVFKQACYKHWDSFAGVKSRRDTNKTSSFLPSQLLAHLQSVWPTVWSSMNLQPTSQPRLQVCSKQSGNTYQDLYVLHFLQQREASTYHLKVACEMQSCVGRLVPDMLDMCQLYQHKTCLLWGYT